MSDAIGWLATAVFAASYGCKRPERLRLVQAAAAGVWIVYGLLIRAIPVIAANAIVAAIALLSMWRLRGRDALQARP